jgi:hypothetical protein
MEYPEMWGTNNHAAALEIIDQYAEPQQHTYSVRILSKECPEDWRWHPYVMVRVFKFCQQYEHQANPRELVRNLQQSFVMDDPGLIVLAFFRDKALIGYMMADRAVLYYKPIVTVHQYALDHGIPAETRHEAIRLVKEWAKERGPDGKREPAEFIQWLVRDKRLANMYKRFFNAVPHMLLMRTTVKD